MCHSMSKASALLFKLHLASRSQRSGFDALSYANNQIPEIFQVRSSDLPVRLRVRGNDVGHLWRVEKGAVDPLIWPQLLSEH